MGAGGFLSLCTNFFEFPFCFSAIVGNLTAKQSSDQQTIALQWSIFPKVKTDFEVFVYRNDHLEVIYGTKQTSYELPSKNGLQTIIFSF